MLHALIRRHLLHPSAAASNLPPSTSNQSSNLFILQSGGVKSPVHSSNAYLPQLQLRSSSMQIEAARTYVTKDDHDYVNPDGVEDYGDDDEDDDDDDLENYSGSDFDDEDEYEDPDAK